MDNRTQKRKIGDLGEDLACRFLIGKGFTVIERNYLRPYGEIDIVVKKEGKLIFVEVKTVTRGTNPFVSGETNGGIGESGTRVTLPNVSREKVLHGNGGYRAEDNIHPWKIKRLQKTIESYLTRFKQVPEWQLDAIIVSLDKVSRTAKIKHLQHIVL